MPEGYDEDFTIGGAGFIASTDKWGRPNMDRMRYSFRSLARTPHVQILSVGRDVDIVCGSATRAAFHLNPALVRWDYVGDLTVRFRGQALTTDAGTDIAPIVRRVSGTPASVQTYVTPITSTSFVEFTMTLTPESGDQQYELWGISNNSNAPVRFFGALEIGIFT